MTLLVLGAVVLAVYLGLPAQGAVLLLVLAGLWWVSLKVWPHKTCRACGGSGGRSGPLTMVRRCGQCGGSGTVPRVGGGD